MKDTPYRTGLIVGRFQMIHTGHTDMIRQALRLCGEVCVLVGSAQEQGTEKNPFSYEQRREMLKNVFPEENVHVFPLPDAGLGNNALWGDHLLKKAEEYMGRMPDLAVSGREERREGWFSGERGAALTELRVPKRVPVSATRMRALLTENDREGWRAFAPSALWDRYDFLRETVLGTLGRTHTDSI